MAGFQLVRTGAIASAAREWRPGRYVPLYVAGIAAGVGIGLGMAFWGGSAGATEHPAVPAARPPAAVAQPAADATANAEMEGMLPIAPAPPDDLAGLLETAGAPVLDPLPAQPAAASPVAAPVQPAAQQPISQPASAPAAAPAPAAPALPVAAPVPASPVAVGRPDFYVPEVATGGPSTLEQRLLDGINAERTKAGLAPYIYDAALTKIARTRSQQMADQGYFAHKDPYGYSMYTELLAYFGYTNYRWAGENLAMNNYNVGEAPDRALTGLMNSPTHKANLLADDFFRIGVGEVTTKDGRHIFAMIFLG